MSQTDRHHQPANVVRALKWLRSGGVDPDLGFTWLEERIGVESAQGSAPIPVWGVGTGGLPYDMREELWVVDLFDVIGAVPFPEQRTHGEREAFDEREHKVLAMSGRLVRRVDAWTHALAGEFALVCALRVRERAIHALRDADDLLGAVLEPSGGDAGDGEPGRPDREALGTELSALQKAEDLLGMWREARAAESYGAFPAADAFAAAAASSRASGVRAYVAAVGRDGGSGEGLTANLAFADERRWQAAWLGAKLGVGDLQPRVPTGRRRRPRVRDGDASRGALTA